MEAVPVQDNQEEAGGNEAEAEEDDELANEEGANANEADEVDRSGDDRDNTATAGGSALGWNLENLQCCQKNVFYLKKTIIHVFYRKKSFFCILCFFIFQRHIEHKHHKMKQFIQAEFSFR